MFQNKGFTLTTTKTIIISLLIGLLLVLIFGLILFLFRKNSAAYQAVNANGTEMNTLNKPKTLGKNLFFQVFEFLHFLLQLAWFFNFAYGDDKLYTVLLAKNMIIGEERIKLTANSQVNSGNFGMVRHGLLDEQVEVAIKSSRIQNSGT